MYKDITVSFNLHQGQLQSLDVEYDIFLDSKIEEHYFPHNVYNVDIAPQLI